MADPTGSIGKGGPPDDLSLIYQGGENFMARMAAFNEKRRQYDEAFLRLKIGNDAEAALQGAKQRLAEAEQKRAAAAQTLSDTEAKCKQAIEDASKQAQKIIADAMAASKQSEQQATRWKTDATSYAAKTEADANATLKDAQARLRSAEAMQRDVDAALAAARNTAAAQVAATAKVEAKAKELQDKLDKLNAAIRAVT